MLREHGPSIGVSTIRRCEQNHAHVFAGLEEAAGLVARHPDYPGKGEALRLCREDILEHESLTTEQRLRLLAILDEARLTDARGA